MKYRLKFDHPHVITAITFDQLLEHGKQTTLRGFAGQVAPFFKWEGRQVVRAADDTLEVYQPNPAPDAAGPTILHRGEVLLLCPNGWLTVLRDEVFGGNYEPVPAGELMVADGVKYRLKSDPSKVVTAITFDQLVEHGNRSAAGKSAGEVVTQFTWEGRVVTREPDAGDDKLMIGFRNMGTTLGSMPFEKGEVLFVNPTGYFHILHATDFFVAYEPVPEEAPPQATAPADPELVVGEGLIRLAKEYRQTLDKPLQLMKALRDELLTPGTPLCTSFAEPREVVPNLALSIRHVEDGIMRLGMMLKAIGNPNPYPSSYDPNSPVVEKTADDLKL